MKTVIIILAFIVSNSVFADGQYDGIWYSNDMGYFSVHENKGTVVIVSLSPHNNMAGTIQGTRNGNTIRAKSIESADLVKEVTKIIMTSDTTFTAIQESCERIYHEHYCMHPDGFTFYGHKIQG